jgi:polysaccharide biosynthesis transport protein
MDLLFLLNALLRKKKLILACTLVGMLTAFLFTLSRKPLYLSAAMYSTGFTMKQQVRLSDEMAAGVFEVDQRFKNVIETFKSPVVIAMLSYDLMLHDLSTNQPFKKVDDKTKKTSAYVEAMASLDKVKLLLQEKKITKDILKAYNPEEKRVYDLVKLYGYDNETLLNTLVVDRVAGTDYLNILFRSENPEMSAYVVNTLGDEFIRFYNSLSVRRTEESAGKLDSFARRKKEEIDSMNNTLQRYKASFGTPDVTDKAKGSLEIVREGITRKADEESKLNTLRGQLQSINTQMDNYQVIAGGTSSAAGGSNAEYVSLLNKNRDLAAQMAKLPGGFDAQLDEEMKANQKKIQQLSVNSKGGGSDVSDARKKKQELTDQKVNLENQIKAQEQTIAALNSQINQYSGQAKQGAGADIKVIAMQSEIEMANKQYANMLSKLQGAEDINLAPDINFKQTLSGQPAIKPEGSNRKMTIAFGGLGAFLVACLIIIMLDFIDNSLRCPSIFNKAVPIKLIASCIDINAKNAINLTAYFKNATQKTEQGNLRHFEFIESIRKLRYEIEQSGKKIFLFTSTKPQEGKTTIITALANSCSMAKKKVLLIDANFANNSLSQSFSAKPTLEKFTVEGNQETKLSLNDIITSTGIPHCDVIGCSKGHYSPSEILPKPHLLQYLPSFAAKYDYIFIEAADLNHHADTKELAQYTEALVPVFSATASLRQPDEEAIEFLQSQKEKLIGAVLNKVDPTNSKL